MSPFAFPPRTGPALWWSVFFASVALASPTRPDGCVTPAVIEPRLLTPIAAPSASLPRLLDPMTGGATEEERHALLARQRNFALRRAKATIEIYPVRAGSRLDSGSAALLAHRLGAAGIGERCGIAAPLLLPTSAEPRAPIALWDLARAFQAHLRRHPSEANYAVYAEFRLDSCAWELGMVHFVVCESRGDWVIVDFQDSHYREFETIRPITQEGGVDLVALRLQGYLARALPDASVDVLRRREYLPRSSIVRMNPSQP